eukprot:256734-Prorocentrum_minimum.AAC.1
MSEVYKLMYPTASHLKLQGALSKGGATQYRMAIVSARSIERCRSSLAGSGGPKPPGRAKTSAPLLPPSLD